MILSKMKIYVLLIGIVLFFGCTHANENGSDKNLSKNGTATADKDKILFDSLLAESRGRPGSEQETASLSEEGLILSKSYDKVLIVDSLLNRADDVHFWSKYYCLKNIDLVIPKKYMPDEYSENLITHGFANDIKITQNGKTVFEKTILKDDFHKVIPNLLVQYGVLSDPNVNSQDGNVIVKYSISIPLTGNGVGVSMVINKKGNFDVALNK